MTVPRAPSTLATSHNAHIVHIVNISAGPAAPAPEPLQASCAAAGPCRQDLPPQPGATMDLRGGDFAKTAVADSLALGTVGLVGACGSSASPASPTVVGGGKPKKGLPLVRSIADDVVMYEGAICEQGAVSEVLQAPEDPYTAQLLADAPKMTVAVGDG